MTSTILASEAAREIERLLQYGRRHGLIDQWDVIPVRNALLDLFRLDVPYSGVVPEEHLEGPEAILANLLDYAAQSGLMQADTVTNRDLLDARIMGLLMPRQSEVVRRFRRMAQERSIEAATDDFYRMSIASNYIRMDRVRNNLYWLADTDYGQLEITVNLSKPEKDPKEIAMLKTLPPTETRYPLCQLCLDNVGYAGRPDHPARQNHRVIPLALAGETWYFQYSPYVYYNEHCIIFHERHVPMQITPQTFERLLEAVRQLPHYFVGSNADLPIVGGSILNHDHFQGGRHVFPMEKAGSEAEYAHPDYADVRVVIVRWPMSVIRLASPDSNRLTALASHILDRWKEYDDPRCEIASCTISGGERTPHNTITPIARRNRRGEYELDLVLRNNRVSDEHPEGIFHPHRELHHIKKENIGLIEVMGLAVLPGRLKAELEQIGRILSGHAPADAAVGAEHPLGKHAAWIEHLVSKYGTRLRPEEAAEALRSEVGAKFLQVLTDAGVYKKDENGRAGFARFMTYAGFAPK
jgi:UDPglucose--hexose-1-phosphate uridylyltransferase